MWTPKIDLQVLLPQCLRDHACIPLRQIHEVWQRGLCSLPHAKLFEAGRFLTSSGPSQTWVLALIASKPVRISFLVFGTHLPSVFVLVSLEIYGAIGQISQLLLDHVSEALCIKYRKGAGIARLVAAGR